jgi:formylglycine-generating enzyme
MFRRRAVVLGAVSLLLSVTVSQADVFNLGGGLKSLETVSVGNPGSAGELSGTGAGGIGTDAIVGGVAYNYQIGKFEVTAAQYCEFLNKVAATDTYGLYNGLMWADTYACKIQRNGSSGSYAYSVASDWANRPVNWVSWGDAARFANWLHNGQPTGSQGTATTEDGSYYLNGATSTAALMAVTRKAGGTWVIPTEDEWYKAAYYDPNKPGGAGYWDYATRSDTTPSNVGADGYSDPGNHANYQVNSLTPTIGYPYYRTIVGEFENSASAYGTFDQGGNVGEWNETMMPETSSRDVRGGDFRDFYYYYLQASARGSGFAPTSELSTVGFRVAFVPEPGGLVMLLAGAIGLLGYAWRRRRGKA